MFDVPIRGSLATLFVSSMMFLLAILATGLIASVAAKNQLVAVQFSLLFSYMPVALLSGFLFPVDNMPAWLRAISMIVPGRYYLTALRGTLLKGNSIDVLAPQVLALGIFALAATALAVSRFKRRLS
jgi:ABC-2 type transport system permease protein